MLYFCKVGDSMNDYKCPKCNAVLSIKKDKFFCEYCRSTFDRKQFNYKCDLESAIPFKISMKDVKKIYKSHIKPSLLTPSYFERVKNINKFQAIYIPVYLYTLDSTGQLDFECNKDSTWKSDGTSYKKTDIYMARRSGNMLIKNMPVVATTYMTAELLEKVFPYDYNEIISINECNIDKYKVYIPNKNKDELLEDIKMTSKIIFTDEIKSHIKNYNDIKLKDDSINLYNASKKYILLPIYLLNLKYKGKKYTYLINGLNGNFYGDFPINKKIILFIWIFMFLIISLIILIIQVIL